MSTSRRLGAPQPDFTDLKVEVSLSPEVALFARLRDKWKLLPHDDSSQLAHYVPGADELPFVGKLREELLACAAEMKYKRADYREFIQLCLMYLRAPGVPQASVSFQLPGALHKA